MESKPPLPPFTLETATAKVKAAEAAWNTRNPEKVSLSLSNLNTSIANNLNFYNLLLPALIPDKHG